MKKHYFLFVALITIALVFLTPNLLAAGLQSDSDSSPRIIEVDAKQFGFEPNIIHVDVGEEVIFKIKSVDVTHGFYIDGLDYFVTIPPGAWRCLRHK